MNLLSDSAKLYRKERKIYWLNKRIEAQQQEIDQLRAKTLLGVVNSDLVKTYDGSALDKADQCIERLEKENDQLKAQAAVMRKSLEIILLKHTTLPQHDKYPKTITICNQALATDPVDYHNPADTAEIDRLKRQLSCERQTVSMLKSFGLHYEETPKVKADELIDKLVADKDQQAGKLMKAETLLKNSRAMANKFQKLAVLIRNEKRSRGEFEGADVAEEWKAEAGCLIFNIDALLGGAEG